MVISIGGGISAGGGGGGGVTFDPGTPNGVVMMKTSATTIGEMTNPPGIPQSLIVNNETISTFTAAVNGGSPLAASVIKSGDVVTDIVFGWSYSSGVLPVTQTLSLVSSSHMINVPPSPGLILPVSATSKSLTGLTMAIAGAPTGTGTIATYSLNSTFAVSPSATKSITIQYKNIRYYGYHDATDDISNNAAAIVADLGPGESTTTVVMTAKTLTVSGATANLYIAYPKSLGLPHGGLPSPYGQIIADSLPFTDYVITTLVGFDNGTGFTEDYYVLKSNGTYVNGETHVWSIPS